jgi:hypothetical protein
VRQHCRSAPGGRGGEHAGVLGGSAPDCCAAAHCALLVDTIPGWVDWATKSTKHRFYHRTEISLCQLHFHPSGVCIGWDRAKCTCSTQYSIKVSSIAKKVGGVLIKKALHIVTDTTDLMYYPFRIWGFILMVRDLLLEDY